MSKESGERVVSLTYPTQMGKFTIPKPELKAWGIILGVYLEFLCYKSYCIYIYISWVVPSPSWPVAYDSLGWDPWSPKNMIILVLTSAFWGHKPRVLSQLGEFFIARFSDHQGF